MKSRNENKTSELFFYQGVDTIFITIKAYNTCKAIKIFIMSDRKFEGVKASVEEGEVLAKNFFHDQHNIRVTDFIGFLEEDEF